MELHSYLLRKKVEGRSEIQESRVRSRCRKRDDVGEKDDCFTTQKQSQRMMFENFTPDIRQGQLSVTRDDE